MKTYQALKDLIAATEEDAVKFYDKGNNAAGTRLRKAMLQMKVLAQNIRKEVSEDKNKRTNSTF